jgi:hypothetical protein
MTVSEYLQDLVNRHLEFPERADGGSEARAHQSQSIYAIVSHVLTVRTARE